MKNFVGIGPLEKEWQKTAEPCTAAYKLIRHDCPTLLGTSQLEKVGIKVGLRQAWHNVV